MIFLLLSGLARSTGALLIGLLGGALSPLEGIGPEQLHVTELLSRLESIREFRRLFWRLILMLKVKLRLVILHV